MATSGKGTATVGYNVQIAVDAEHHLIVAHEVTNQGYDRHQLAPMALKAIAMSRSSWPDEGWDISYETVRRWVLKFGPAIARRLRRHRPRPSNRWHLDESAPRTHDQQRECGAA